MTQTELNLSTRKPHVLDEDVAAMLAYLQTHTQWPSAETIARALWPDLTAENGKRRVRAVAEASKSRILSRPGVAGYKLATLVSVDTYMREIRPKYAGQIHKMTSRLKDMDRWIHGRERTA